MRTKENLFQKSIENLKKIGCYKPYLENFKKGVLTKYIGPFGYDVHEDWLLEKIKDIEKEYGGMVYAVLVSKLEDDELYSFLYTSSDEEFEEVEPYGGAFSVHSYTWNKSCEWCSSFGDVGVRPALGGLVRIW